MTGFFLIAAMVCIVCVVVIMLAGLFAMTQDKQDSRIKSNKMMQLRVIFQGLAVAFLALAYLAK